MSDEREEFEVNAVLAEVLGTLEQAYTVLDLAVRAAWPVESGIETAHVLRLVRLRNGIAALYADMTRDMGEAV